MAEQKMKIKDSIKSIMPYLWIGALGVAGISIALVLRYYDFLVKEVLAIGVIYLWYPKHYTPGEDKLPATFDLRHPGDTIKFPKDIRDVIYTIFFVLRDFIVDSTDY